MKRTVQINLGGVPLTIDDDAYRKLDSYLVELEQYFSRSGNQEEIMVDIESRIAELLSDMIKSRPIVEMTDVEAAIKVMGTPTDFDDAGTASGQGGGPWDIKTGKRLFRSPDDKVIGGVCSGLAAYFGVQEVIWIRLAFVLVFLTLGFGVIVYVVMWWLVPEAKTAADRLAMEGEPANARNIGRMVERGIEDLSSTIKQNWKQWHDGKHERRKNRKAGNRRDKPVYVFAAILIPFVLVARFLQVIARIVRRAAGSGKVSYQKGPFV
jgi:phage shock protein PspC (stress-responsive transcriptional regulator)